MGRSAAQGQSKPRKLSHAPWSDVPPTKGSSKTTSTDRECACVATTVPRWPKGAPMTSTFDAATRSPSRGGRAASSDTSRAAADVRAASSSRSASTSPAPSSRRSSPACWAARIAARFAAARWTAATASADIARVVTGTRADSAVGSAASHLHTSSSAFSGPSWPKRCAAFANLRWPSSSKSFFGSSFPESLSATASTTAGQRFA
mmetsp:Transcript_8512/g.29089  ORF Transcript_8512/g.29089 Transcript_8512/m.29089 type:complete len:205 (-) Transcript_8512:1913-2527(-)